MPIEVIESSATPRPRRAIRHRWLGDNRRPATGKNNRHGFLYQTRLYFPYDFVNIVRIDLLRVVKHYGAT